MAEKMTRRGLVQLSAAGMIGLAASTNAATTTTDDAEEGSHPRRGSGSIGGTRFLPFLSAADFASSARRAAAGIGNYQTRLAKSWEGYRTTNYGDNFKIGVVFTPEGRPLYGSVASGDGDNVAFYTEIGDYQVAVLGVGLGRMDGSHTYYAAIIKNENPVIEARWTINISHSRENSINPGGVLSDLVVAIRDKQFEGVHGAYFDKCIKRHTHDFVEICLTLGKEACIACAGVTIGCCWYNCHC